MALELPMKPALLVAVALSLVAVASPLRAAEDPREVDGRALFARGEYEGALEIFSKLFAETGDPVYLRNVGRCYQMQRKPGR